MTGVYADALTRRLPPPPGAVWAALEDTSAYGRWWPWLASLDTSAGLVEGATWHAAIRAPLPYTVGVTLALTSVDPAGHRVASEIDGDVRGTADVRLGADAGGTLLAVSWRLVPVRSFLRALDATARPVARWGHDVVMRRSVDAFVRALDGRG